jgi:hypothetical protein
MLLGGGPREVDRPFLVFDGLLVWEGLLVCEVFLMCDGGTGGNGISLS